MRSLVIFYLIFSLSSSSFVFSQVLLKGYKVPGIEPPPGHIINIVDAPVDIPIATDAEVAHLPKFFDARKHWPQCSNITSHISFQASCGSCWAVSVSDVISDRLCIASKGRIQKRISAYHLLTCCGVGYCADGIVDFAGCRGADHFSAFSFYDQHGLVTEDCMPFPPEVNHLGQGDFPEHMNVKCETECQKPFEQNQGLKGLITNGKKRNYTREHYKGTSYYRLPNDEATIRKEIYEHGPVVIGFDFHDFLNASAWKEGDFYFCQKENQTINHGVRAIGWGEDEQLGPYWLLANSFGSWWRSSGGLFKMVRGKNLCNVEKFAVGGIPKVEFEEEEYKWMQFL